MGGWNHQYSCLYASISSTLILIICWGYNASTCTGNIFSSFYKELVDMQIWGRLTIGPVNLFIPKVVLSKTFYCSQTDISLNICSPFSVYSRIINTSSSSRLFSPGCHFSAISRSASSYLISPSPYNLS